MLKHYSGTDLGSHVNLFSLWTIIVQLTLNTSPPILYELVIIVKILQNTGVMLHFGLF